MNSKRNTDFITNSVFRKIERQFRTPKGALGNIWGLLMDRGNRKMIKSSIDSLSLKEKSNVLEIGFGGGLGLQLLLEKDKVAHITGIEVSEMMLSKAKRKFKAAIENGQFELIHSSVDQLPSSDDTFDGAVTVNTVYFWKDLHSGLAEIRRVLKPGGHLVLGIRTAEHLRQLPFVKDKFTIYEVDDVKKALSTAGFNMIKSKTYPDKSLGYICLTAHKSGRAKKSG